MVHYWYGKVASALAIAAGKRVISSYGKPGGWKLQRGGGRSGRLPFRRIPTYKKPSYSYAKKYRMPKRRRSYRYKPRKRRRRFRKGYDRTGGFYRTRPEMKFHDVLSLDEIPISSSGVIVASSVNTIAQGVGESQRIGRKCTIHTIDWHYTLTLPGQIGDVGADIVRVILYQDMQTNGGSAAVLQILQTTDFQAHYNPENRKRFRILFDRSWAINATAGGSGTTGDQTYSKSVHGMYKKRCHIPIEFSSTTGAITEMRSNNIGVLAITKLGDCGLQSSLRLWFSG